MQALAQRAKLFGLDDLLALEELLEDVVVAVGDTARSATRA
jgi:hypothetical protein